MALRARLREARRYVCRIGGLVEVVQVTSDAVARSPLELTIDVTLRAGERGMRAGQRESREGRVIEYSTRPGVGVVALRTGLRKPALRVVRVGCGVEVLQVARDAIRWRAGKSSAEVARRAVQPRVCAGQGKAGELGVVELRALPRVHAAVALAAGRGKANRLVIGRLRPQVRPHVTAGTVGGQSLELTGGCALVARIAL